MVEAGGWSRYVFILRVPACLLELDKNFMNKGKLEILNWSLIVL